MSTLASLSDTKRKLLNKFMQQKIAPPADNAICNRASAELCFLSLSQEQLVIREQKIKRIPLYNESFTLKFNQPMDREKLESSMAEVIHRHEIWRTHYDRVSGQLVQVVDPEHRFELPLIDLRRAADWQKKADVQSLRLAQTTRPFDLLAGPLLRAALVAMTDAEYWLIMTAHQSIIDGVSVYQIFPRELFAIYAAFSAGRASPLSELVLQFSDFARWQRTWLTSAERFRQITYWRNKLQGCDTCSLRWPSHKCRPHVRTFRGRIRPFALPRRLADAVDAICRRNRTTMFVALLAAFYSLLHSYTGQTDLVVGTFSPSGRKRSEVQGLLGYFLNPVALRVDLADDPPFVELLRRVQIAISEAISNDDVPFEEIVETLAPTPDPSRNPYFDVAMSLQPCMPDSAGAWSVTSMDAENGGAAFDLYVAFIERSEALHARVQYNPDIFEFEQIQRMIDDFQTLLSTAAEHPEARISKLGSHDYRKD